MNKKIKSVSALLFIFTTNLLAVELPSTLQGNWQLNVDESMELIKKNPKFKVAEASSMVKHLKKMAAKMIITVSENSVTMTMGQLKQQISVDIISSEADKVVTKFAANGKMHDLTLKILKGKYLQLISSATDDINSFAWEKK